MKIAKRAATISPFYVMELLGRARELEAQGREIIHMEVGEPDFPTPQPIVSAGMEFLKAGNVHYTPAAGLPALREKIATYYASQYGIEIPASRVFITPGASGALLLVLAALLDSGDEVLLSDPGYPCNQNFIQLLDGKSRLIPVEANSNYHLTAELVEKNWGDHTRGILISSPSNPTGTIIGQDELEKLFGFVRRRNGFLISDEIYHGLTYAEPAASALALGDDLFVINSFSKQFGMTGWRLGWAVVPEQFTKVADKLSQNIFIAAATHSQHAALAAFEPETVLEIERRKVIFKERRDFLYSELIKLGFSVPVMPDGAFYIYADCSHFTNDSYQFCMALLEKEDVAVTPGRDFGLVGQSIHIRFAYTTDISNIAKAVDKIGHFLKARGI
jgi:aspartate/methionine/tyrosine aminotransferase